MADPNTVLYYLYNIFNDKPYMNNRRIFPTQQRDVQNLVESVKNDPNVKRLIIFGSSVTPLCNPWSDIDAYYEMEEDKPRPDYVCENAVDVWTSFTVDEDLLKEIKRKGVVVYERDSKGDERR